MVFDLPNVRLDLVEGLRREWARLAVPGSFWSGGERVAIASAVRRAREGKTATGELPQATQEAARTLGADPEATSRAWVEDLVSRGLAIEQFVELVGVVSRLTAVDGFTRAAGFPLEPLPEPTPGVPSGNSARLATKGRAWVPMVGGSSIVAALSLVPAENEAMLDFHGPLYLTLGQMADHNFTRGLTRAQMELVAARTSTVNECFY